MQNRDAETPLHYAKYSKEFTQCLLKYGAPNVYNTQNETPLHKAVWWENIKVVSLLLAHGAAPNTTDNKYGLTPLHAAVIGTHTANKAVAEDKDGDHL